MPIARSLFVALLMTGLSPTASHMSARQAQSGAELLKAAERSFSDVPFGTKVPPPGLTLIENGKCASGRGECSYIDANHVVHYFEDSEGTLVVKSIDVAQVGDSPITALGIGRARVLDEVVRRVRRFLPGAKIDCDGLPAATGTPQVCGATLGDGWIKLFFDSSRRLTEVRIDAYHFT